MQKVIFQKRQKLKAIYGTKKKLKAKNEAKR